MSELKVDKITPRLGTTLTLGDSGDTINFGSGVLPNFENLTVTGDLTVDTNSLKVDSTNNYVGIGTASPNKPLHIETTGETVARIVGGTTSITGLYLGDSGNGSAGQVIYDNNGDYLRFNTSSTERVRITSAGNVGIGTTSPSSQLHIVGSSTSSQVIVENTDDSAAAAPDIFLYRNSASPADNDVLGHIEFRGENSAGEETRYAVHNAKIIDVTDGTEDGQLEWQILNNGGFAKILTMNPTELVINEDSQDTNFRVESDNSANALFVEGSSGNVGIKNSSPSHTLDISDTTTTSKTLRVGQSSGISVADATIIISNGGSGDAMLRFDYEGTNTDRARIGVTSSGQNLQFFTAGNNERMRIDSSGNVLVGKTSQDSGATVGTEILSGRVFLRRSGGAPIIADRDGGGGEIVVFREAGTKIGSINDRANQLSIGSSDTGLEFNNANDRIQPFNMSINNTRDNAIDLGGSEVRFKDFYLGGNIYLGGTGSANALDDYEEGTWSPAYTATGGSITATTTAHASYVKVGNMVYIQCKVATYQSSLTGDLSITGLPFTSSNVSNKHNAFAIGRWYQWNTDMPNLTVINDPNTSTLILFKNATNTSGRTRVQGSDTGGGVNNSNLVIMGCYQVD